MNESSCDIFDDVNYCATHGYYFTSYCEKCGKDKNEGIYLDVCSNCRDKYYNDFLIYENVNHKHKYCIRCYKDY